MTDDAAAEIPDPIEPDAPSDALPLAHERELAQVKVPRWPRTVIGVGAVLYGVTIIVAFGSGRYDLIEPVFLVPVLAYIAWRIARRIAAVDRDPWMVSFVMAAFWAKMIGTLVRALVVSLIYDNRSDALDYHQWGQFFAPMFRGFDFSQIRSWSGTEFMRTMTGVIYSVTGASEYSGAIVFSFMSFVGLLLLWRAFARAVPDGLHRRYAILVLFLPSFLYWPSALGKEGWAIFCLGIASYGVALVMTREIPLGVAMVAAGLFGVTLLRPHVSLTIFSGIFLAAAVGKSTRPGGTSSILRMVLFGMLVVLGTTLAASTAQFFGVERLDQETINQTLSDAEGRTSEAGSTFTPVRMSNPLNTPLALVTVLFRPLPIEASSPVSFGSSLEGVFLIVLAVKSGRRLRSIPRAMRRTPYVAYSVGIMFTFIFAFSSFSNFGILARQRCQVLPFFLVLLCLPEWKREGTISIEEALAGRVDVPDPHLDEAAPAPYQSEAEATDVLPTGEPVDPYVDADFTFDPYERFRDRRGSRGRGDG